MTPPDLAAVERENEALRVRALEIIDRQIASSTRREAIALRLAWFSAGMTVMAGLHAIALHLKGITP